MNMASFWLKEFIVLCCFSPKDHLYFRSQMKNKEGGRGEKGKEVIREHRTILGNMLYEIR